MNKMKEWLSSNDTGQTVSATVDLPELPPELTQDYELVPVDRISTHPDNARKGSLDVIRESIRTNGFYGACVVQRSTGHILVGNHRYLAAVAEGLAEVPVVWVDKSDLDARRLLLVDNRSTDVSAYDEDLLSILLTAVSEDDAGLAGTGYDDADLQALIAALDTDPATDLDYGILLDDGKTPGERLQSWQDAGIRSLILPYPVSEYEGIVAALAKARTEHGVDTNAEAVKHLLGL